MSALRSSRSHGSSSTACSSAYRITDQGNSNMKVVVRIRPENGSEAATGTPPVVRPLDDHILVFDPQPENLPIFSAFQKPLNPFRKRGSLLGRKHKDLKFAFDRVFDCSSTQQEMFEESTKDIVEGVLNGVNCSVFAYGATGAGKTHTMLGTSDSPGVMFHTMMELYRRINQLKTEKTFEVIVSYCEVYNESIHDLLAFSLDGGSLELREDSQHGLVVSKLSKHQPEAAREILQMLDRGNRNRTQHPTDANSTSSRSHAVFQVYVHQKPRTASISTQLTCAKLSLIDLAGSERATMTTNRGARLREGANINRSLLALGNCINALAENKGKLVHIPYRNSKLTRLLKDSLGGNCRTVMIANVSPSSLSYEDTYNTLKYADRAKQIKTKVVRNVVTVDYHVTRYRTIVQELQKEISELKSKLEAKTTARKGADCNDASRLQEMVREVYGERSRLRKHMVDMDTRERETLLRVCRKERDLKRIEALTKNESKKQKLAAKVTSLQQQVGEIERQKQMIHEYLYSNNESIGRIQKEIKSATTASPSLRDLMSEVVERNKLETENAHHWRQTKHLLRYIKSQEREIGKTERVLLLALEVARTQQTLLVAHNGVTPTLRDAFSNLVRMAEGEKGVAWADQSTDSLRDVSLTSLSLTQQALFDTFIVKVSPARRLSLDKHSPSSGAVRPGVLTGILSNSSTSSTWTGPSNQPSQANERSGGVSSTEVAANVIKSGSPPYAPSLQPRGIPDKPRMPTPLDDSSSSCSSSSTYSTRLNTVLNSYHPRPGTVDTAAGLARTGSLRPHKKLVKQLSAPEPYLTPQSRNYQEHSNDSGSAGKKKEQQQVPVTTTTTTACSSTPLRNGNDVITTSLAGSSSGLTPVQSRFKESSLSTSFTKLFSEATKCCTVPVPCPVSPSQLQTQSNPSSNGIDQFCDPQVTPSRKAWDEFEDDFVSSRHDQSLQCRTSSTRHTLTTDTFTTSPSQQHTSLITHSHTSPFLPPSLSRHSSFTAQSTASKTKLHRTAGRQAVSAGDLPYSSYSSSNAQEGMTHKENGCSSFPSKSKNSAFSRVFSSSLATQEGIPVTASFSGSRKAVFVASQSPSNPSSSLTQRTGILTRYQGVSTAPSTADTVPTSTSSSLSYRHSQPKILRNPYSNMSPMLTVQTHSTVVSLHPASNATPSARHSITVGLSHTHESEESRTRPRPSAFAPPSFSSVHKHSHTSVSTSSTSSSSSSTSSLHTTQPHVGQSNQEKGQHQHKTEPDNQKMEQGSQETEQGQEIKEEGELRSGRDHKQLEQRKQDILHSRLIHSAKPFTSKQPLSSNPALNSTFTVAPTKSHHRLLTIPVTASHGGPGRARTEGSALNTLHVNSPQALEDRARESSKQVSSLADSSGIKRIPSYLQLTKSAASKRVIKLQNKENGSDPPKHRRLKGVRSNGLSTSGRSRAIPQAVW